MKNKIVALTMFVAACSGFQDDSDLATSNSLLSLAPVYLPGNPTCQSQGYAYEGKVDSPAPGTSTTTLINGHVVTFTLSADKTTLSWSSPTLPLDAVMLKASDGAYIYAYDPEATSGTGLETPATSNNTGNQAALSHVSFCYDFELVVDKTASTTFQRDHAWSIQKTAATTTVLLSLNQFYNLAFSVVVSATGYADSGWAVGGTITVTNPDPNYTAVVGSVTDAMTDHGNVAVTCEGVTFPASLAPGASLTCTYATAVTSSATRTNTATATTTETSPVDGGSDSVDVVFSDTASTVTTVDGCVTVTDTHQGSLGQVCASEGSKTFNYNVPLQYAVCGPYSLTNTATYTGASETNSSTVVVSIDVPCQNGCTLTQGYWKTHSSYGPAPHDEDGWANLENETFFLSGQSQYTVLWTPVQGNPYYALAHQYIAAARNAANGATFTDAQAAFDAATALFNTYTPAQVKLMKQNSAVRQQFTTLAYLLDQYNNGVTGPGHCTE